jgi:1-acyl-sn-glycerol-3-phosphate acyltransferase
MKFSPKPNIKLRKIVSKLISNLIRTKYEVIGEIDKSANMYMLNHVDMADIILFEDIVSDLDLCWVSKKEIANVPVFGNLITRSDGILVDREDKKSLMQLLKDVKDRYEKNRKIVIFPEGTRNKTPETLGEFKAGTKMIGNKYNLKIQPIVLVGVGNIVQKKPFFINKQVLKVVALPTIEASKENKEWYEKSKIDMQKALNSYL